MKRRAKIALASLGLAGAGAALALRSGSSHWKNKTAQLVENLEQSISPGETQTVSFKDFDRLPTPVAKYFRRVLKEGQPLIRSARITHAGEFRVGNGWSPFESKQYFSARPPGFVWDADIRMNPLMNVRVRDAYFAGQGSMQARVLGLVPVVDQHDKAELNAGALQRYLAEAVWFPTALLPDDSLEWSAMDDNKALATLTDSGTTVSLEFHFDDTGEITGVFSPARYREVNGHYELAAWSGRFRRYEERNGMRIPMEGEVEWQLPGGNLPYWKGRIVEVDFELVPSNLLARNSSM